MRLGPEFLVSAFVAGARREVFCSVGAHRATVHRFHSHDFAMNGKRLHDALAGGPRWSVLRAWILGVAVAPNSLARQPLPLLYK